MKTVNGHGAIDLGSLLIMRRRLLTRVDHLLAKVWYSYFLVLLNTAKTPETFRSRADSWKEEVEDGKC